MSSEWASFGLSVMHQMFFPLGVKVVDQLHVRVRADGVGVVEGGGEQARRLGRDVVE